MRINKAFRYRLYPTPKQASRLDAWGNTLRWLWNLALEQRRMGLARPRDERIFLSAYDQINQLTELRELVPWLADVPRNVCAQLLIELDKAWQRTFQKLARAPRWKRKGCNLSLCEPHAKVWRLAGSLLRFPKVGNLRAVVHRSLEGKPKTCAVYRDGDQWFAVIVCELHLADPVPRNEPVVGIDRGVVNLIADSDGNLIPNPSYLERTLGTLARAQRSVARKKKGSKNHKKAIERVRRIHRKVRRQRDHLLHVLSSTYAKNHGTVVVEKLHVANMIRVRGTLGRRIAGAGWGRFVELLRYKLAWHGGNLVEVIAAYSSQTCHMCGHIAAENRRSQASFECSKCGLVEHADLNAALVIKSRWKPSAQPGEASGLPGRRPRKSLRMPRRARNESLSLQER